MNRRGGSRQRAGIISATRLRRYAGSASRLRQRDSEQASATVHVLLFGAAEDAAANWRPPSSGIIIKCATLGHRPQHPLDVDLVVENEASAISAGPDNRGGHGDFPATEGHRPMFRVQIAANRRSTLREIEDPYRGRLALAFESRRKQDRGPGCGSAVRSDWAVMSWSVHPAPYRGQMQTGAVALHGLYHSSTIRCLLTFASLTS